MSEQKEADQTATPESVQQSLSTSFHSLPIDLTAYLLAFLPLQDILSITTLSHYYNTIIKTSPIVWTTQQINLNQITKNLQLQPKTLYDSYLPFSTEFLQFSSIWSNFSLHIYKKQDYELLELLIKHWSNTKTLRLKLPSMLTINYRELSDVSPLLLQLNQLQLLHLSSALSTDIINCLQSLHTLKSLHYELESTTTTQLTENFTQLCQLQTLASLNIKPATNLGSLDLSPLKYSAANLHTLVLAQAWRKEGEMAQTLQPLINLTDLSLYEADSPTIFNIEVATVIGNYKHLRRLELRDLNETEPEPLAALVNLHTLEELYITRSRELSADYLLPVLNSCSSSLCLLSIASSSSSFWSSSFLSQLSVLSCLHTFILQLYYSSSSDDNVIQGSDIAVLVEKLPAVTNLQCDFSSDCTTEELLELSKLKKLEILHLRHLQGEDSSNTISTVVTAIPTLTSLSLWDASVSLQTLQSLCSHPHLHCLDLSEVLTLPDAFVCEIDIESVENVQRLLESRTIEEWEDIYKKEQEEKRQARLAEARQNRLSGTKTFNVI